MNTETREIRDMSELSDADKASGKWVPLTPRMAKKYAQKQPVTDADFTRIMAADAKRRRKAAGTSRCG